MRLTPSSLLVGVATTALSIVLPLLPSTGGAFPPATSTTLSVVDKMSLGGQIGTQVFASCQIRSDGGTCTITRGRSVSRQVQLTWGMAWSAATAQLGIGSETSVATTVSCSSPALAAGTSWKARPVGTKYYYKIRRQYVQAGHVLKTEVSGRLTAFNPSPSHISCGLR